MVKNIIGQLSNWQGKILVDDKELSLEQLLNFATNSGVERITLNLVSSEVEHKEEQKPVAVPEVVAKTDSNEFEVGNSYRISVKKYMTQKSTPSFDFMEKWNNDIPMPLMTMVGKVVKQTRGMVYMELTGEVRATSNCMYCGRKLTNPISRLYGIGPECGSHFYINPFTSEEELNDAIDELNKKMKSVKWTGWVVKSSIQKCELVEI